MNRRLANAAGKNSVNIKLTDKAIVPGIYIVRFQVDGKIIKTYKMVKSKR